MHANPNRPSLVRQIAAMLALVAFAAAARADIFQWEYINPADPSQGKQQSATLATDGAGVDAVPEADLSNRNLTMAYLIGADLAHYSSLLHIVFTSNLSGTNLTDADLTHANFAAAILTHTDFTDAQIRGANFAKQFSVSQCNFLGCGPAIATATGTGITIDQLYSTSSYQAHDLSGIGLDYNDLAGANFAGQNLTNASFSDATLTGADYRNAILTDVPFDSANLTGANFAGQDLTNAIFNSATLTGADFTDADVRGASFYNFNGTGITLPQLYSTASYQARDFTGIGLGGNHLGGGNFAGQNLTDSNFNGAELTGGDFRQANLTNAFFSATLIDADFRESNLTNADFSSATLANADFTGSEVRGANFGNTGFTLEQLYSTASYQAHYLTGINLSWNSLAGGNFAGQNLTNANFYYATLTDADFRQANLTNAYLDSPSLAGAEFSDAEVRGASLYGITPAQLYSTASYRAHDLTGIGLSGDLSGGNFAGQNLTNANFSNATLTDSDFSKANLASANFEVAMLTDADFTGAGVRGASFGKTNFAGTGITPAQLYSTASYRARDLTGIVLYGNNLSGGNFAGQNLSNAVFGIVQAATENPLKGATLAGADFSEANLANASFGSSDLSGANFRQANLANANFSYIAGYTCTLDLPTSSCSPDFAGATLTGADFTGAEVRGAIFTARYVCDAAGCYQQGGLTLAQLYSTASYQAHDLSGIGLRGSDLAGGNFAGQNLTNANVVGATLTGVDFTAADVRGALGLFPDYLDGATTTNLIRPDGQIDGLDLDGGGLVIVRDHDGNPKNWYDNPVEPIPIPVTVDQHMSMGRGGTLRMVFEADAWDSTISFEPGIPVTLGGTLELTFADDVNLASQVGRTFDLFDWTGVTPTGAFAVSSPYVWNLSNLDTTGEVTLAAVPEPISIGLVAVGAFSLTSYRRRNIS